MFVVVVEDRLLLSFLHLLLYEFCYCLCILQNKKLPRNSSGSTSDIGDVSEEEEEEQRPVTSELSEMSSHNGLKSYGNTNDSVSFDLGGDDEVYTAEKSKITRSLSSDVCDYVVIFRPII